ncbi:MAG: lipase family protein [Actinomycetota bacterium]
MRTKILSAAVVILSLVAILVPAARAGLLLPRPDADPFYAVPDGIDHLTPGDVIDARPIRATVLSVPIAANAWQIRYRTIDQHGAASAYVATVLVPLAPWVGGGPRPLLAYNAIEAGLSLACTASYALRAGLAAPATSVAKYETGAIALAVARGWAVVVPDYQGPRSEYLGMDGYATGVLDAIRTARRFAPAGVGDDAPIGVMGYSAGALATVAAALAQPSYAPDITIAGVASGGTPGDIVTTTRAFSGDTLGGILGVILGGIDRSYPKLDLSRYLNAEGRAALAAGRDDCLLDGAVRHPRASIEDWATDPKLLDRPRVRRVMREMSPLTRRGNVASPILLHHAGFDEYAPLEEMQALAERFCVDGVAVQTTVVPALTHFSYGPVSAGNAFDYLADRFAAQPAPSQC